MARRFPRRNAQWLARVHGQTQATGGSTTEAIILKVIKNCMKEVQDLLGNAAILGKSSLAEWIPNAVSSIKVRPDSGLAT
ncbi:hypothetical protein TOPH_06407 [Tolypocladium ophioglossoides CBS 100239]|uniref:Uncharacterized protein n=1 Tax=Tolypocladium ophioglossoides (strain CBS 100239) TaxID=1163406 RepID=A0A0L0N4C8_TOLOC|nr:hypothetical protein TOPH_06407 [Tolypocladium ophioglossoides CBS 100239]